MNTQSQLLHAAAMLAALISGPCYAAEKPSSDSFEKATRIAKEFGNGLQIDYAGFLKYVNYTAFVKIDKDPTNGDPPPPPGMPPPPRRLTEGEYSPAFLYAYPDPSGKWIVDESQTDARFFKDRGGLNGKLTAERLLENNEGWRLAITAATYHQWQLATHPEIETLEGCAAAGSEAAVPEGPQPGSLTTEQLAVYLDRAAGRAALATSAKIRLERLVHFAKPSTDITRDAYLRMSALERFEDLDKDWSCRLDIREFVNGFKSPSYPGSTALKEFVELAGSDLLLSFAEFNVAPGDPRRLPIERDAAWLALIGPEYAREGIPPARLRPVLLALEKAARSEAEQKAASGPGFLDEGGYLLSGNRIFDPNTKKVLRDRNRNAVVVRIIKDFLDSGETATAAAFSHTHTVGNPNQETIDGAFRFDLYTPNRANRLVDNLGAAMGMRFERVDKDKKNVRTHYLIGTGELYPELGPLRAIRLEAGPRFEIDEATRVEKLVGMIELEPVLRIGKLYTGVHHPIGPKTTVFIVPSLGFEMGEVTHIGSELTDDQKARLPRGSFFRYGFAAGVRLANRITLKYRIAQRDELGGGGRPFYQEVTLDIALDPKGRAALTSSYKRGRDTPSFEKIETITVGLGLKL